MDDVAWLVEGANLNEESFSCPCIFSLCLSLFFPLFYFFVEKGRGSLRSIGRAVVRES